MDVLFPFRYTIHRCPHLKVLDYEKVKLDERAEATAMFGELGEV